MIMFPNTSIRTTTLWDTSHLWCGKNRSTVSSLFIFMTDILWEIPQEVAILFSNGNCALFTNV